jgi:pectate lyase
VKETGVRQRPWLVGVLALCSVLAVSVASASESAVMEVVPDFSIVSPFSGNPGGPITPSSVTYTLTNRGTAESLSWCAAKSQPWITLSIECGVLAPGSSAVVTASIDESAAATLPADGYSDPIVFTNLTNDTFLTQEGAVATGSTRRFVTLNILGTGPSPFQGFGAGTRGGADGAVFRVTTLDDNGDTLHPVPGSLRDAVSQRNRMIVFDVAGTIALKTFLWVQADHITIDGFSAPPPGITLTQYGIILRGNRGAHDIVLRGLRIRDILRSPTSDTQWDGIQIANGAFNILVDHVSVHGADDGSIDITERAHDVTVSWSIIGPPNSGKNMLVKYGASRVTLHHNVFAHAATRNALIEKDDESAAATEITVDMRNNLVWGFAVGTLVARRATANVVNNYYSTAGAALAVQTGGRAYTRGNVVDGSFVDINAAGTELAPFPAASVDTDDAATAGCQIRGEAGVRPLDAVDEAILASILPQNDGGACFAVGVVKTGSGGGTVVSSPGGIDCGTRCVTLVDAGTLLTLTAMPATGSTLFGFSGPADCAEGRLAVSAAVTCVARFERKPDLVVSALSAPLAAEVGSSVAVRHTTLNRAGGGPANATTTRLYLSKTTSIGTAAQLLASVVIPPLDPGQSRVTTSDVVVPPATPPGTYYVVAQADALAARTETYETNNTQAVRMVVGADLSIAAFHVPTTATPGASILVKVVTANATAVGPAAASVTRLYLSRDTVASATELVAERPVATLGAGVRDTWSFTLVLPPSLATGTYYLIARADDGDAVAETRETNNRLIRAITIRP